MSGRGAPADPRFAGGIAALVVVAFGLLLWPPFAAPVDGSIDSAWRWGLAAVAARDLDPALIPYGPLGDWLEPRAVEGSGLAGAATARSLVYLAGLAGLVGWAARGRDALLWLAAGSTIAAGCLVAGHWPDHALVLLVPALLAPALDPALDAPVGARWRPFAAGALVGLAPLLKLTVAVGALGAALGFWVALGLGWTRWSRSAIAWGAAGALAGSVAGSLVAFDSPGAALGWLGALPAVASVYPNAMALEGGGRSTLALVGPLAVVALAAAVDLKRREPARGLWLLAAVPIAAALRHGAIRPDVHALALAAVAASTLALSGLLASSRGRRWGGIAAALLALAAAAPHAAALGLLDAPRVADGARSALVLEGLRSSLRPERTRRALLAEGARRLDGAVEPDLVAALGGARGLDVVPWKVQVLGAAGRTVSWVPSPALLLPLAAAPELDRRTARHFDSDRAPGQLLVHADRLEGRPLLWESPLAWRAIRRRYRVTGGRGPWRIAERLGAARGESRRALGEGELRWGAWEPIPEALPGEAVRVEIELRPTLAGRLRRALYRAEPVWLDLPGRPIRRFRVLSEWAAAGLELSPPGATLAELEAWLAGRALPRADRVRLRSRDAGRYRPVRVRWWAVRLEEATPSALVPEGLDRPLGEGAGAGGEAGGGGQ